MTSGIITILAMVGFAAVVWWAYGPNSRDRFKAAEQLPLNDEAEDVSARAGGSQ
ncbi:cbb3-type cytochrome c oxidase subunit 3 [uncultured Abyssibacter sp.]|uniref:cbb3-type cytochrome oxidase subunit 3 n=1 Tax=uncultured Abyssibacter sp. TaxID=2320202 RepID=UPI0032B128FC